MHQSSELGDRSGMQAQFGFIQHDGRWRLGLQKQRRQCDKPQGAIGQVANIEQFVVPDMPPSQPDQVFVQGFRPQNEGAQER
jgi:hypothetical protein